MKILNNNRIIDYNDKKLKKIKNLSPKKINSKNNNTVYIIKKFIKIKTKNNKKNKVLLHIIK